MKSESTFSSDADESMPRLERWSSGAFRVMLSGIFIVAGANHLLRPEYIAERLANAPLASLATWAASPETLVILAGFALLAGGISLLLGLRTRAAALVLLLLIIPITVTVQVGRLATLGPLFKNIGLAGALIYFAVHGSPAFSFDSWLGKSAD